MASRHSDRSRAWQFTLFVTDDSRPSLNSDMSYLMWGEEVCPTTGRPHLQGAVYFKNKKTLLGAKRAIQSTAHMEIAKDWKSLLEYNRKDKIVTEFGHPPAQGSRTDLLDVVKSIASGELKVNDLVATDPLFYHQYGRTLERAEGIRYSDLKRNFKPDCVWSWGPTGVGKTRSIVDKEPSLYFFPYDQSGNKFWWDSYAGEEAILFDDFRGQLPLNEVLRLTDRYDYRVCRRGKCPMPMLAKRIYFTSCKNPDQVYDKDGNNGDAIAQLIRRVTVSYMESFDPPMIEPAGSDP